MLHCRQRLQRRQQEVLLAGEHSGREEEEEEEEGGGYTVTAASLSVRAEQQKNNGETKIDRKSTRLNSSHKHPTPMPSSALKKKL